jgi:hypothetical protein
VRVFYCTTCGNVIVSESTETSGQHLALHGNALRACEAAIVLEFDKPTFDDPTDAQVRQCNGTLVPVLKEMWT